MIFKRGRAVPARLPSGHRVLLKDGISERKGAEYAVRWASAYNRSLIEASLDPLVTIAPDGKITDVNNTTEKVTGLSRQQLIGTDFSDYFTDSGKARAGYEQAFREGLVQDYELEIRHRDGHVTPVLYNASVYRDEAGDVIGVFAAARDITERKRAEEALKKSTQLLRDTGEMAKVGGWELDLLTQEVSWTEEVCRIHGVRPGHKPKLEEAVNFYAPESRPALEEALKKAAETGEPYDLESLFIPSGSKDKIWVRSLGRAVYSGGKIVKLAGTFQNIDKYKRAEEALRQSKENFEALAESASEGILIGAEEEGRHVYANRRAAEITGYPIEELLKTCMRDIVPPDELPKLAERYKKRLEGLEVPNHYETALLNKDDARVPIEISPSRTIWQNQPANMVIFRDITERKWASEALRESEERFRSLVENATVGIYRTTPDGHILMANPALVRMLGFDSFEELAGRNLECGGFEPSYPRSVFRERIEREGQAIGLEGAWIRRDGSVVFVRESGRAVRAEEGRVLHYDGIVEDITTRRHAEEALRQLSGRLLRLQDEERRHIARELHDITAQSLAGLAINLSMVKDSAPNLNPRASACLSESLELAEQCSREIRTLSYLLHPPLVDEAGLAPALRWYTAGFAQRSGIAVHVDVSPELGRLPSEVELTLYRIVQEALTNIHLHSRSKTARICLERQPEEIVLRVADEGHGFPSAALGMAGPESTDIGVGIPGMRERLRQLGGRLHIQTGSRGTTLTAYLPLSEVARGETTHPTGG
jgi:PAS domain S-box-containing protein